MYRAIHLFLCEVGNSASSNVLLHRLEWLLAAVYIFYEGTFHKKKIGHLKLVEIGNWTFHD